MSRLFQALYLKLLLFMETQCGYSQYKQFGGSLSPTVSAVLKTFYKECIFGLEADGLVTNFQISSLMSSQFFFIETVVDNKEI